MSPFLLSALGGAIIGAAAAGLLLLDGRIAGVSGILGSVLAGSAEPWRWAFLAGLALPAVIARIVSPEALDPVFGSNLPIYAIGGVLVGIGTRVGAGCTSGHGVCGLANLSPRSLAATLIFMGTAGATVFLVRHG
ncbi:MAG TPA: YeeE/YedE thiosulfate transporter family protein [Stellaceae bacterium]|nr:YeeE/YedE thiosulfate transporter family protein [Stellaceae bacterium]